MYPLGQLSAAYESNNNPACVSSGTNDPGGKSYGLYQLASKCGSVRSFLDWLKASKDPLQVQFGESLDQYPIGSTKFDEMWRRLGHMDPKKFGDYQHDYIKHAYYDAAVDYLQEAGFDATKHSSTLQNVIWSRAVQYGPNNIVDMFSEAVEFMDERIPEHVTSLKDIDALRFDWDLIVAIYDVCQTKAWNNSSLRHILNERFEQEKYEAIFMLEDELDL